MRRKKPQLYFIISMLIFGSIGLFVKKISMASWLIVLMRTIIGSIFLIFVLIIGKQPINKASIKNNFSILLLSGLVLGAGWVSLFETYNHTTVSTATLIYYSAPIIVFLLSPVVFKESLNLSKTIGIMAAIIGMILVNGFGIEGSNSHLGLIYGIISALLYATLMILKKFIKDLSGLESTLAQLIIAALVMIIYALYKNEINWSFNNRMEIFSLLILGIFHTGIACYLYFSSMKKLPGQTVAILSYIDPVSALFFSAIFLNERLAPIQILGAFLILGGTAFSQLYPSKGLNTDYIKKEQYYKESE